MLSWISKIIFYLIGWKLEGTYPNHLNKKVLIVAPHTSTWDVPLGLLIKFWLKMDTAFYGKKELFKGFQGWLLTKLGARPVDRSQPNNLVRLIVSDFQSNEKHTIVITPEGTRKKVNRFKSGFYFIADIAKVPIVPIAFDYQNKRVIIMDPIYTHGAPETEIREIENKFKNIVGKIPENSFT